MSKIRLGSSSWRCPSWKGLVYADLRNGNLLSEYARKYSSVELDQWFWSFRNETSVSLPRLEDVAGYAASVPDTFRFTVKVPNCITLTHLPSFVRGSKARSNPFFLSVQLFKEFLGSLEPLKSRIGVLLFQFEYLSDKKMANQSEFLRKIFSFFKKVPEGYTYALEPRNPSYLNKEYFFFLKDQQLSHVFLEGYYMPRVADVISRYGEYIEKTTVLRLHGNDHVWMEERTRKNWNRIVDSKDGALTEIAEAVKPIINRGIDVYLNVDNHYEGSAPKTMEKLETLLLAEKKVYASSPIIL